MLTIKNRNKILGSEVVVNNITYTIDGVYLYETHYKIHLRCYHDKSVSDELILLNRTRNTNTKHTNRYTYYDMYWNVDPQNRLLLSALTIGNMKWVINAVQRILEQMK